MLLLLKARLSFLHHRLLSGNTLSLQTKVLDNYAKALQGYTGTANLGELYIEYSRCLLCFYKYNECEEALNKARDIMKLSVKLTGKMGRRSKYSTKSIP